MSREFTTASSSSLRVDSSAHWDRLSRIVEIDSPEADVDGNAGSETFSGALPQTPRFTASCQQHGRQNQGLAETTGGVRTAGPGSAGIMLLAKATNLLHTPAPGVSAHGIRVPGVLRNIRNGQGDLLIQARADVGEEVEAAAFSDETGAHLSDVVG